MPRRLLIFPLMKTSSGLQPGQFELAVVTPIEGSAEVECPNPELRARLQAIFSTPVRTRRPVGESLGVIAFRVCEIPPEHAEFLSEVIHSLRHHGLYARWAET